MKRATGDCWMTARGNVDTSSSLSGDPAASCSEVSFDGLLVTFDVTTVLSAVVRERAASHPSPAAPCYRGCCCAARMPGGPASPPLSARTAEQEQPLRTPTLMVFVHVRQKVIPVSTGAGSQSVEWLAHVAIARCDMEQGRALGTAKAVKLEDGRKLDLDKSLVDAGLTDNQHVWVVL
eukprot:6174707-Pleurochrysis_carterae.AAC.1